MLAKWLPASANGYLNLVPGVTAAMLVSPGAEFEAEIQRLRETRRALLEPYHAQLVSQFAIDANLQVALADAATAKEVRRLAHGEDTATAASAAAVAMTMSMSASGY